MVIESPCKTCPKEVWRRFICFGCNIKEEWDKKKEEDEK